MKKISIVLCLISLALHAWNGFEVANKQARLFIHEIEDVKTPDKPTAVRITLENKTEQPLQATVRIHKFVDDWKAEGPAEQAVTVAANSSHDVDFQIVSGPFVFDALYPVHAQAVFTATGAKQTLDAVRIFGVKRTKSEEILAIMPELPTITLQNNAALSLADCAKQACYSWTLLDSDVIHFKPVGWNDTEPQNHGSMRFEKQTRKREDGASETKKCISMHPPYVPKGGSSFANFKIALPASKSIKLSFAHSQRDSFGKETQSDGMTFRVWVDDKLVYEKNANVRTWMDGETDLTPFAGKTILLRLETNPGPANDTQVDYGYFGNPTITAGTISAIDNAIALTDAQLQNIAPSDNALDVIEGQKGLIDGWILLKYHNKLAAFHGFNVELDGIPLRSAGSAFQFINKTMLANQPAGTTVARHHFKSAEKEADLDMICRTLGNGVFQIRFEAKNAAITHLALGPWHNPVKQVIYGHGYVLRDPQPFVMGFGGHNVAASHFGLDFMDGYGVLAAVDTPPVRLDVNLAEHNATFHMKENSTLTFAIAPTAFEAAFKYQKHADKHPAGAFSNLSGRFVFDIWGGTATTIGNRMMDTVRYGLVDSMLTIHGWQRWGYDYRLPDVWPPNKSFGTVDNLLRIQTICGENNIPWGLHDNYIDFYPDADDYSYKHIYFNANGKPTLAWINRGRNAQSYKFRPDHILPFVQRNFKQMTQEIQPTACFIDVFTSSRCVDYYDSDGNYHPQTESRKCWGEAFAWIRNYLGGNAPTTSEAGHDQLTGYLDGADCQWMTLSPTGGKHLVRLPCADWERVPWADAVNHDKFALIGVGYSVRYEGGRPPHLHGINSDDYISMELLSSHNLMTDASSWGYNAVRKYWLAQDFIRYNAAANMTAHEFIGGDIHRQHVTWENGSEIWVNRSAEEWEVNGHRLPQYGYYVRYPEGEICLEKASVYREYSRGKSGEFYNARNTNATVGGNKVNARPSISEFKYLGGNKFQYKLHWDAKQPAEDDFRTYVHFMSDNANPTIIFQDDHFSTIPTSNWNGVIEEERTLEIPATVKGTYVWVCGLYKSERGRMILNGPTYPGSSINLGKLAITRNAEGVVQDIAFTPQPYDEKENALINVNADGTMVDFGSVKTNGVFRLVKKDNALQITPVPQQKSLKIVMDLAHYLPNVAKAVVTAEPLEDGGKPVLTAEQNGTIITLNISPTTIFSISIQ
jgi:hypothetical protein